MMTSFLTLIAALFQAANDPAALEPAPAQPTPVNELVVVELFTSQGCGMCPDANRLLSELGEQDGVLALGWGVNYWDVYGWEDQFARPEFVDRQQAYVDAGQARRVYTPHFVINGDPQKLRFRPERIRQAVDEAGFVPRLTDARIADGVVQVSLNGSDRAQPAEVWLVEFHPGVETQPIGAGSNAGLEMIHYNMVRRVERLGDWAGGAARFETAPPGDGLAGAVLVQDGPGGRILTAARLQAP